MIFRVLWKEKHFYEIAKSITLNLQLRCTKAHTWAVFCRPTFLENPSHFQVFPPKFRARLCKTIISILRTTDHQYTCAYMHTYKYVTPSTRVYHSLLCCLCDAFYGMIWLVPTSHRGPNIHVPAACTCINSDNLAYQLHVHSLFPFIIAQHLHVHDDRASSHSMLTSCTPYCNVIEC